MLGTGAPTVTRYRVSPR